MHLPTDNCKQMYRVLKMIFVNSWHFLCPPFRLCHTLNQKKKEKKFSQYWPSFQDADIAVASLTITYSRSEVIDFTVPYMHLGISILYKKPAAYQPNHFAFMAPLSSDVWLYSLCAYIVTSLLLWLLSMITPYERVGIAGKNTVVLPKQFTLHNSFWFTVSSLMQQVRNIQLKI